MTTLRLLTGFKPDDPPCDDRSYTCMCEFHVAERLALQPWEPRPAKAA
jgi:hypothetical protein